MLAKLGITEIALVLVCLLILFGPAKLPVLGRSLGETIREFRKSFRSVTEPDESADPDRKA